MQDIQKLLEDLKIHQAELEAQAEELRQSQLETQESRDKYKYFFDHAPVGYLTIKKDGSILEANLTVAGLLGIERKKLIRSQFAKYVTRDSQETFYFHINKVFENSARQKCEIRVHRSGDSDFWAQLESISVNTIEVSNTVNIVLTDITERKKAEDLLSKSEQRLLLASEAGQVGIFTFDFESGEGYWSPKLKKLLGIESSEPVRMDADGLVLGMHPEDRKASLSALKQALDPLGDGLYRIEYRIIHPDNSVSWLRVSGHIEFAGEGKARHPTQSLGATVDITELKQAHEALKRHTLDLESVNKELEAFSYSVSHDLRAPLRSLDGFSQAVIEEYGDKLDEQGKDYLNRVRKASQRMSDLINDLLKLSRLSRAEVDIRNLNLSEIAEAILEDLKNTQPERKVEFVVSPGIQARGNKPLLTIALQNLLGNSWKFTDRNSQARIEFGVTEKNGEKVYFVRDNGAGFNMKYSDKLFQAFQRLHSNKEFEGTGIGLAIVQRVIRRHGGRIWAESEEGKGTTLYFTLGEEKSYGL